MERVCIFGYNVLDALRGKVVGGAELQMALLAKTLAGSGIFVVVIDREAKSSFQFRENIWIEAVPDWDHGIRGIRFFTHRVPNLIRCLRNASASVYYVRGCTYLFFLPLYVARRLGAKFVMALSHDAELWTFRKRYKIFYRRNAGLWDWISTIVPNELAYALIPRFSDMILVQHQDQKKLADGRGLKSMLFPNIVNSDVFLIEKKSERKNVLIVGAITSRKSLHLLIPVVKKLKNIVFEFIGAPGDAAGSKIQAELKVCSNAVLHGRLDRRETLEKVAGAKVLLNTSQMEGFPNAFLEAWALGTPVISLFVDPGDVIKNNRLGYVCAGDIGLLENLLDGMQYDIGEGDLRLYVEKNHSPGNAAGVFRILLSEDSEK